MATARAALILGLLLVLHLHPAHALTRHITVFAASSLSRPFQDIIELYNARAENQEVRGVYGASGFLARQIETDAPVDLYVSAYPFWMDRLRSENLVRPGSVRSLASNRIALLGASGIDLPPDLRGALLRVQKDRIGIADPAQVGSGHYAMQVLKALDLWDRLQGALLVGENEPAITGMVARNQIPVAFAYASDATAAPGVHLVAVADAKLHDPIRYQAALTSRSQPGADLFLDFLTGPEALKVLLGHGFLSPPGVTPAH